jgi:RND family efflux transporter MFP subunit
MSDPSNKSSAPAIRRTVIAIAVLAILVVGVRYGLQVIQPLAVVEAVVSGPAIDAKAGSVVVSEDYSMQLKSELAGRLLRKDFDLAPGKAVKEGQILGQLDANDLRLALAKGEIDYKALKQKFEVDDQTDTLNLQAAARDLANFQLDNRQGRLSDDDLHKKELAYKLLQQSAKLDQIDHEHQLAAAENGLEIQRDEIAKMTLYAPFDGVIKTVFTHPGDLIDKGTPVAEIITVKKVVKGEISDEDSAKIRVGQPASVIFTPYGGFIFNGKVSKILPTADPDTQRHVIYLDVDIPPEKLVAGISGEVSVVVDQHVAPAVIPRRAIFSFDGDSVYVVENGFVRRRSVEKGFVWAKGVEVTKGLAPGELVLTDELENYHDGERVRIRETPSDVFTKVK